MQLRGLQLTSRRLMGAVAVLAVATASALNGGSPRLGLAIVVGSVLTLAYAMFTDTVSQCRKRGLPTPPSLQTWLFLGCTTLATAIIAISIFTFFLISEIATNFYPQDYQHFYGYRATSYSVEGTILGMLAAVGVSSFLRWASRPHELWQVVAPPSADQASSLKNLDEQ